MWEAGEAHGDFARRESEQKRSEGTTPAHGLQPETTTTGGGLLNGLAASLYEKVYVRREVRCQRGRCGGSRVWWGWGGGWWGGGVWIEGWVGEAHLRTVLFLSPSFLLSFLLLYFFFFFLVFLTDMKVIAGTSQKK